MLQSFLEELNKREYGDATRAKLNSIAKDKKEALSLELAALLDMRILVSTTYQLEGDRLEILLIYDKVQALRSLGRSIKARADGIFPNVDALLRHSLELKKDIRIEKHFDGFGIAKGKLVKKECVDSTLYPARSGARRMALRV